VPGGAGRQPLGMADVTLGHYVSFYF